MCFSGVRPAAVAGTFYPGEPERLRATVVDYLREGLDAVGAEPPARAVIVPHAGYIYSGAIAGTAFARLAERGPGLSRVVLLGPAHRVAIRGLALPAAEQLLTPLGRIRLDRKGAETILALDQVSVHGAAHSAEHSLEVELPFLQIVAPDVPVVPLVVGWAEPVEVAEVLALLWDETTAVVVSSDLSHFLSYGSARRADEATAGKILELSSSLRPEEACGAAPVNGLLYEAKRRGHTVEQLDLRSSGDTAGDRSRVVGYGAFAVH